MWPYNKDAFERAHARGEKDFRSKFCDIPYYIHLWTKEFGGLDQKRALDFGCGSGISACGVSLFHNPSLVYGVDINQEHERCAAELQAIGINSLPDNLKFETVQPGDISSEGEFDFVFSWSVFEHVHKDLLDSVIFGLRQHMSRDALILVQIAPLYFSPEGGHLWEIGYTKWEQLSKQLSDLRATIMSHPNLTSERRGALWSMFETLNRITSDELIHRFEVHGFSLVRQQRDHVNDEPSQELSQVYRDEVLRNFQIVALFRKA